MIKNIIFDLAGVVMNLNLERDSEALQSIGLPNFAECIKKKDIFAVLIPYLNVLASEEEFLKVARPLCPKSKTDKEILDAMDAVLDDVPLARIKTILELRKKYRIFMLSNIYASAWQHIAHQFAIHGYKPEDCFERLFLSYEMQLAKPDPRIFQQVFSETGINPDETVYFDDSMENISMGKNLGLHARLVPMNHLDEVLCDL